jgi:hypothetical protein
MAVRPNFTSVELDGGTMTVNGLSDEDSDPPLDVHVFVAQAGHIADGSFDKPNTGWTASLTVTPGDFSVGRPALAYGVELRKEPVPTTTTWSQLIDIEEGPKA